MFGEGHRGLQGSARFAPTVFLPPGGGIAVQGVARPQGHPSIVQYKRAGGLGTACTRCRARPQQDQSHHLPTAQRSQVSPRSQSTQDSVEQSQDASRPQRGGAEAAALLQGQKKAVGTNASQLQQPCPCPLHPGEKRWAAPLVHVHCRRALSAGGRCSPYKGVLRAQRDEALVPDAADCRSTGSAERRQEDLVLPFPQAARELQAQLSTAGFPTLHPPQAGRGEQGQHNMSPPRDLRQAPWDCGPWGTGRPESPSAQQTQGNWLGYGLQAAKSFISLPFRCPPAARWGYGHRRQQRYAPFAC